MVPPTITSLPCHTLSRICRLLFEVRVYSSYDSHPPNQPHLAALALTCKYCSGPALDALWHRLGSVAPLLLYTLPEGLCAAVPATKRYQIVFLRDPVPEDFARLLTYASRVKSFSYTDAVPPFLNHLISTDAWAKLSRTGPNPLFPNLRTLHHHEAEFRTLTERNLTRGPFYPVDLLLGAKLTKVHIAYGGWPCDQHRPTELVRAISRTTPLVTDLNLFAEVHGSGSRILQYGKTAFLSCPDIGNLRHLVKFEAYSVNVMPAALVALGTLPVLQEMLLRVESMAYDWDLLPDGRQGDFFPALAKVKLYETPGEWCVAFIHAVTSSSLWKLETDYLFEGDVMPDILFEALCASLGVHPSRDTLQVLDIRTTGSCPSDEEPAVYQSQHIAPLLSLSALRHLYVRGNCQIVVDDDLIDAMTWAWPHIQSLHLRWPHHPLSELRKPDDDNYPKATLFGMLVLARYCPSLRSLELAIDMRDLPDLDRPFPPVSLRRSDASLLHHFRAAGSVLGADNFPALASFLSVVFPNLRYFRFPDPAPVVMMRLHENLLAIRGQERKWAGENGSRFEREDTDPVADFDEP